MPKIDLNQFEELAATEGIGEWLKGVLDSHWSLTIDYADRLEALHDWVMQNGFRTSFNLPLLSEEDRELVKSWRGTGPDSDDRLRDSAADPEPADPIQVEWVEGPEPESDAEPRKLWSYDLPLLPPMPGAPINIDRVDDSGPEPLPSLTLTPEIVEALLRKMTSSATGSPPDDPILGPLFNSLATIQLERGW